MPEGRETERPVGSRAISLGWMVWPVMEETSKPMEPFVACEGSFACGTKRFKCTVSQN